MPMRSEKGTVRTGWCLDMLVCVAYFIFLIVSYCFLLFLPHFQCSDITRSQESHIPAWWLTMRSCNCNVVLICSNTILTYWLLVDPLTGQIRTQTSFKLWKKSFSWRGAGISSTWKLQSQWNRMEPAIKNSQDISRQLASSGIVSQFVFLRFVFTCFFKMNAIVMICDVSLIVSHLDSPVFVCSLDCRKHSNYKAITKCSLL